MDDTGMVKIYAHKKVFNSSIVHPDTRLRKSRPELLEGHLTILVFIKLHELSPELPDLLWPHLVRKDLAHAQKKVT